MSTGNAIYLHSGMIINVVSFSSFLFLYFRKNNILFILLHEYALRYKCTHNNMQLLVKWRESYRIVLWLSLYLVKEVSRYMEERKIWKHCRERQKANFERKSQKFLQCERYSRLVLIALYSQQIVCIDRERKYYCRFEANKNEGIVLELCVKKVIWSS